MSLSSRAVTEPVFALMVSPSFTRSPKVLLKEELDDSVGLLLSLCSFCVHSIIILICSRSLAAASRLLARESEAQAILWGPNTTYLLKVDTFIKNGNCPARALSGGSSSSLLCWRWSFCEGMKVLPEWEWVRAGQVQFLVETKCWHLVWQEQTPSCSLGRRKSLQLLILG